MFLLFGCFTTTSFDTAVDGSVDTGEVFDTQEEISDAYDTGVWPEGEWVVLGSGTWHTCAVNQNAETICWGRSLEGQTSPPQQIPFRQIVGGRSFSCGLSFSSTVHCWGEHPTPILEGNYKEITAGKDFVCGIDLSHKLSCMGLEITSTIDFLQIDAGEGHVCGIDLAGGLHCFGANDKGQSTPPAGVFSKVQAGFYHSCALAEEGITCWGDNYDGATDVPLVQAVDFWSGNYHNCALNHSDQAICWGGEGYDLSGGIIGVKFTQLALGGFHTCGMTTEDTLYCQGENTQGQCDNP